MTLPVWVDHVGSAGTRYVVGDLADTHLKPPSLERMPVIEPMLSGDGFAHGEASPADVVRAVTAADPPLRVMSLHALLYCERLFYLEEVEEIRKAIELFEQRLTESYQHPHTGQSLSYARIVELEVRLLEKEWTGCPGLFARLRLR